MNKKIKFVPYSLDLFRSIDVLFKFFPGNLCSHGSKCIKIEKGYMSKIPGRKYRCDCSYDLTIGQDFYAGYSCEYAATDYCTDGFYANQEQKSKAFCTNGSCVNNIFIAQENQKQE